MKVMISENKIDKACEIAYKEAGHNAYFGNGFNAGIKFALQHSKAPEMLEMLKAIHELGYDFDKWEELEQLIKQATEL